MIVRFLSCFLALCLAVQLGVKAEVEVKEHAYQNLLISFAPNVPSEKGLTILDSLKELLQNTSEKLHSAIGVPIGSVTLRLPSTWDPTGLDGVTYSPADPEEKPDVLLDGNPDSAFGKQPVAMQHGGCGVPGHQIALPVDFLTSTEDYPKGTLLAREWLKYRYGVFDENGFEKDSLYPDYYKIQGSSEVRITDCTDPQVEYYFKDMKSDNNCTMEELPESGDCKAYPTEESAADVKSSLMYFHRDLPKMEQVCGKDHPHKDATRSKQNLLCNGKSIWEVLKQSSDFADSENAPNEHEPIKFSIIQDTKPRVAVVWENTEALFDKREVILFGVRRLVYELPTGSKCGVYSYTDTVSEIRALSELPVPENREVRVTAGFVHPPEDGICTTCALMKAVEDLQKDSIEAKGTIHLIASSKFGEATADLEAMVIGSSLCLHITLFVNPDTKDDVFSSYEKLNTIFPCFSHQVIYHAEGDGSSFEMFRISMDDPIPKAITDFEEQTVAVGVMSFENPLVIPKDPTPEKVVIWINKNYGADSIDCKVGDAKVTLTSGQNSEGVMSFQFEALNEDVSCKLKYQRHSEALVEARVITKKGDYFDLDVWTHDTTGTASNTSSATSPQMPVIVFTRIQFGKYPVKGASVKATVKGPSATESQEVVMFDNGIGDPDITQHDGIYSGYFLNFSGDGEYTVEVEISDNEERAKIGKNGSDICCGSQVKSQDGPVPSFRFMKSASFKATDKKPDDGYRPSRVIDLTVREFQPPNFIILTWTAPGGGKASSYEFYLHCDSEDCNKDGKLPQWLKLNQTEPKPSFPGEQEAVQFVFTPELPRTQNLTLFFVLKSVAGPGMLSDSSNKAEVALSELVIQPPTTIAPNVTDDSRKIYNSTIGTIVGSTVVGLFIVFCLSVVCYFYVYKRLKGTKPVNNDPKIIEAKISGSGHEISGSFKAIDVRNPNSSMKRGESFPVLLYTHDQLKDYRKKKDPPLYRPAIVPKPWMSMNLLSSNETSQKGDRKSLGSASTIPATDRYKSSEIRQLDDLSHTSEPSRAGEESKF